MPHSARELLSVPFELAAAPLHELVFDEMGNLTKAE
jgi:hypothetical protein